ncbi:MAG: prolyl oligopeptidase family serine peptidase [Pirellulaceae bacterium]|nr:prolyl oligopeptidase family serine peptidase [Pirellulaceae bacterium]
MTSLRSVFVAILVGVVVSVVSAGEAKELPKVEPDVVYGHKDGLAMTMDVLRPEGEANRAAILFMVSGGWFSRWAPPEQTKALFRPYLEKGYTVIAVRHGSSPRYTIPEAVSDVRRAVRFVRKNADRLGVDANRLGAMGMSAGGHLALMLGTTGDDGQRGAADELSRASSRVAAVVALVPPTDLRVAVWEAPESLPAYRRFPALELAMDKAKEYSPVVHVTPDDAPSLVLSGGKDDLVPPKHGRWIEEAFKREGVPHKLVVYPEANHNLGANRATQTEVVRETLDWFDRYLLEKGK